MNPALAVVLVLLAAAIVLFAIGRPRMDVVALLALVALALTGIVTLPEALAGFADPNVILVAALFVVGEGLNRTGVTYRLGDWLAAHAGASGSRLVVLLMLSVAALGSVMSSTGVVAIFVPVALAVAKRLYDTLWAIILPSAAFAIPITVLILVNFMRDIPQSLFESMQIDGAGDWSMLTSLMLPLIRPALVTVGIYDALTVWNGFLFPLVLTQSSDKRVLPLSLWTFQGEFTTNIPAVLAAVVLSVLPLLTAYIFGRQQLVAGLTAGFSR
ncbi:MAG TPA: SLC13 family permease [Propionicimonas sp.]|nr:SLC13 family permease [Propionicimonas sp.]